MWFVCVDIVVVVIDCCVFVFAVFSYQLSTLLEICVCFFSLHLWTVERKNANVEKKLHKIDNQWMKCRQFMWFYLVRLFLCRCRNTFCYFNFLFLLARGSRSIRFGLPNGENDRRFLVWKSTNECGTCTFTVYFTGIGFKHIHSRHLIYRFTTSVRGKCLAN